MEAELNCSVAANAVLERVADIVTLGTTSRISKCAA